MGEVQDEDDGWMTSGFGEVQDDGSGLCLGQGCSRIGVRDGVRVIIRAREVFC